MIVKSVVTCLEYFWTTIVLLSLLGTHVLSSTHSRTFQNFTMSFEFKFMSLLSPLEYFYARLESLLGIYVLSRTHLAYFKLLLWKIASQL